MSGDYARVTGVAAQRGRWISAEDVVASAAVLVLSDRTWRTRFDGDPDVIGRVVRLGGHPFEIIGIAARGFEGIHRAPITAGVWIPLSRAEAFAGSRTPAAGAPEPARLAVLGRLGPGRTTADASGEIAAIARRLDETRPTPCSARPTR